MTTRIFVCRCEDVSVSDVEHTLAAGLTSIEDIKRYTGLGTGPCQGKECLATLSRLLADRGVIAPEQLRPFTARPPVEPVSFAALATVPERLLVEAVGGTLAPEGTHDLRPAAEPPEQGP